MPWWWEQGKQERKAEKTPPPEVLPYDVRYALSHRGAHLTKAEVLTLVRDGSREVYEFVNAALYLLIKAQADDPEKEERVIQELVRVLATHPESTQMERKELVRNLVEHTIRTGATDWTVDARNLAGIPDTGSKKQTVDLKKLPTGMRKMRVA